jgi:hypothetical protein
MSESMGEYISESLGGFVGIGTRAEAMLEKVGLSAKHHA